ncbi:hypothetical protein [Streptomyces sp. NPDC056291]|uniref:hypothetical protein n=1 Tax=Streptomyces sp. NPDC056291 TaxID=3345772 RepID=UPI0035E1D22E
MLHEAAHILAWRRGLKDTSVRAGLYHNQTFLAVAEEVGLEWPAERARHATTGFIDPELSVETRHRHADDIAALDEAIPLVLPHLELPPSKSSNRPDRLVLQCGCDDPRKMRMSRTVVERGPVICGVCGEEFKEA